MFWWGTISLTSWSSWHAAGRQCGSSIHCAMHLLVTPKHLPACVPQWQLTFCVVGPQCQTQECSYSTCALQEEGKTVLLCVLIGCSMKQAPHCIASSNCNLTTKYPLVRSDQAHTPICPHEGHAQMSVMNSLTKVQLEVFGFKGAGLAVPGKLAGRWHCTLYEVIS